MPKWVHRTTKQFINSVASADLSEPVANYIEEPDLSAVVGWAQKYWIITGDVITLMSQAARDAVDATALDTERDNTAAELDQLEGVLRAFAQVVLDEFNVLRNLHAGLAPRTVAQLKTALRGKLGS